jgi:hypothetical protein
VSGCGCQTGEDCGCHSGALRGYRWHLGGTFMGSLAAISPADAANQVFPTAKIRSGAGHNQSIWNSLQLAAQTGQMVGAAGEIAYIPGTVDCAAASGVPSGAQNDLKLVQTGSGLALQGVNVGLLATGTALGPLTAGISIAVSAIVGLFSTLINHHAQAVRQEQSVLCSAVPAANNYLKIISQAVLSGQVTPQQGVDALDSLLNDFEGSVSSIRHGSDPTSSGECNAACVMQSELHAIVLLIESEFQDMINAANAAAAPVQAVVPARPNTTAPIAAAPASSYAPFYASSPATPPAATGATNTVAASTSPVPAFTTAPVPAAAASTTNWLPIAAMAIAGFFLLRSL